MRSADARDLEAQGVVPPVIAVLGVVHSLVQGQGHGVLAGGQAHGETKLYAPGLPPGKAQGVAEQMAVGAEHILAKAIADHHPE